MAEEKTIWTIGHSTHQPDVFIQMLQSFNISMLADIRTYPGSRKFPHFNKENLQQLLLENGINYLHFKDLGGRRKPVPDSINTRWQHPAFRGYADHMQSDIFNNSIDELQRIASHARTAYMCSEAVWWSCHRSLVSDYLKVRGWKVWHIMAAEKATEHPYTKAARIVDEQLRYDDDTLFS